MNSEASAPRDNEPGEDDAVSNDALADALNKAWDAAAPADVDEPEGDTPGFAPAEASDDAATDADATPAEDNAGDEPAEPQPLDPPARWSEADKAKFASWPRDVQEAVTERHKAMEAVYTRKTQELSEYRKQADPLVEAVKPHADYLSEVGRQLGLQPGALIGQIVQAERMLRTGDSNTKVNALLQLAQSYGIDLANLAKGGNGQPDPLINDMRQQLQLTQRQLDEIKRHSEESQQAQLHSTIESFRSATDDNGQPKHPHFERVKAVMGTLMQNGEASTLEDAYTKAVEPIQAAIAEELKARQAQADAQRKASVEKAKKAAPVRSSGASPNGTATTSDLDSLISQTLSANGYS